MACGTLEIDILNTVWRMSELSSDSDISIREIADELSANGIERAYTTIKTVMDRLTAKSILVRYKSGKKFFYKAVMTKNEMIKEALATLSKQFFDGNYSRMAHFIEEECGCLLNNNG